MKITLATALTLFLAHSLQAQIQYPNASFISQIRQEAGFTNFVVNYERPLQRGRDLFGVLVPYGKPWKTGAGFYNSISFDQNVFIGDKEIAKGTYYLVSIPFPDKWYVMLSTDTVMFSKNKPYEPEKEVVRLEVQPKKSSRHYEAFTIDLDVENNDLNVTYSWGDTYVSYSIKTRTTQRLLEQINALAASKEANAVELGDAAEFIARHLQWLPKSSKDTAIKLIDRAISIQPEQWMYRVKRDIYWYADDLKGIQKASSEWIAYLNTIDLEERADEIRRINELVDLYRKAK